MAETKSIGEASVETRLLYEQIRKMEVGQVLTYEELNAICGGNTQQERRGNLTTARKKAEQDLPGLIVDTVMGVGIKRVEPSAMVGILERKIKHISRTARSSVKRASRIVIEDMDRSDRASFAARISLLNLQANMGKAKQLAKLESAAGENGLLLNQQKVLEMFSSK